MHFGSFQGWMHPDFLNKKTVLTEERSFHEDQIALIDYTDRNKLGSG